MSTTVDTEAPTQPIEIPTELTESPGRRAPKGALLVAVVLGVGISVGLGVYGKAHTPSNVAINLAGFSSGLAVKTWLTTAASADRGRNVRAPTSLIRTWNSDLARRCRCRAW